VKLILPSGSTSVLVEVFIQDSSVTTGAGLTGLVFNTSSLTAYYYRKGAASATAITLATMTLGTWATGGFVAVDGTNMPGVYQLGIPNAALAAGATGVIIELKGATNMVPVVIEIQLDAQVATVTGNVTGSVGSVTGAVGSVTGNVGGNVVGSVASVSGNVGGSVASVSGNVTGSVASVSGNVGGNVVGSVASVTAGVTVTTNNDKTGYTASTVSDKTGYSLSNTGIDALFTRQLTESYSTDGAAPTVTQALMLIQQMLGDFAISGTTLTVRKVDGSTSAATFTLSDATNPTGVTRAS
jgi:hypothetical protein